MNLTEKHALEAADARAFCKWEDGEGAECATGSGVWFAAIAYERARVAALKEAHKKSAELKRWKQDREEFLVHATTLRGGRKEGIKIWNKVNPRPKP